MKEVDDKLENISQSLSRVLVQIYKDWGKDILFIVCITIILFTTQAVLLPNNLLLSAGEINWKVALVVIGLSIYWYVVSILTTTYVFLCLNYSDPRKPSFKVTVKFGSPVGFSIEHSNSNCCGTGSFCCSVFCSI